VAYDGRTLIKSLVDRSEPVAVKPGDTVLAWAFAHAVKEWSHSIGYSLGGGPIKILEQRSEAKKDPSVTSSPRSRYRSAAVAGFQFRLCIRTTRTR
jgi:hypothetical protein